MTSELLTDLRNEYDALRDNLTSNERDDLVRLLVDVREMRAELAAFAKDVERDLLAHADTKRWTVEGLGEVEVKKSTKRSQWDNDSLTRVVVARALDERLVDEDTGEYESGAEAVARVLMECSRPSWRVVPLRARGIDETEFCHVEDDGWDIRLPPRRDA